MLRALVIATLVVVFAACSACSTPKTVPAAPTATTTTAEEAAPTPAAPMNNTVESDVAELNRTLAKIQMDEIERWANESGLDEATRTTRVECLKAARVFNEARLPWWRESKNGERVWVVQDKLTQYTLEYRSVVNVTRWSRTDENGKLTPRSTGMRDWTLEPYRDLYEAATAAVKWIQAAQTASAAKKK